jgi:hypothetical protein
MKSLRYVLGRGVFALALMAIGVGTGIGMPPARATVEATTCPAQPPILVAARANPPAVVLVAIARAPVRRPGAAS